MIEILSHKTPLDRKYECKRENGEKYQLNTSYKIVFNSPNGKDEQTIKHFRTIRPGVPLLSLKEIVFTENVIFSRMFPFLCVIVPIKCIFEGLKL